MTTKQDIETALIGYVNAEYNSLFPLCPIAWGNAPFDYNVPPDVYVQALVSLDHSEQLAVNSPVDRHYGNVHFCVITKSGLGTGTANQIADYFFKKYRHQGIGGNEVRGANMAGEGASHDGYEIKVTVPFVTSPL